MSQALKTTIFLSIIFFTLSCKKNTINPSDITKIETGITSRINRVISFDNTCIMAGGEQFLSTEVFVSKDGGTNFVKTSYHEAGKAIYGMGKANDGTVYLSGFDGKLLVSGTYDKFNFHQINLFKFYNGIAFTSNKSSVFTTTEGQGGGTIVRLDSNFSIIDTTYCKFGLNDIQMPTDQVGYIAAFGTILKTEDGGISWGHQSVKNDNFQSIHCFNKDEVWTVGYNGSLWHTIDGGVNWEQLRNGNSIVKKRYRLLDVLFKDNRTGWACGEGGLLLYTTDGGNNWEEYENFTESALRDMALLPNNRLIVVGDNGAAYKIQL